MKKSELIDGLEELIKNLENYHIEDDESGLDIYHSISDAYNIGFQNGLRAAISKLQTILWGI